MARIELTPEAALLKYPVSTDKFIIYKRCGKHYLRLKQGADYSNPGELFDSINQVIHEKIMNSAESDTDIHR